MDTFTLEEIEKHIREALSMLSMANPITSDLWKHLIDAIEETEDLLKNAVWKQYKVERQKAIQKNQDP